MLTISDRNFVILYDINSNTFEDCQRYISKSVNDVILEAKIGSFSDFVGTNFAAITYNQFNEVSLSLTFHNELIDHGDPGGLLVL